MLFFTGLSGSGKSTLARALMDRILEQGARTVTSLDGDVVRRNLSAGLTFSKEDRETNIRRIGWVAAEIARHGGIAVCSPIAPFDETRQQVRAMVDAAGGAFFLVHVATPLEECERRDRKGLYAKARRGEIPEFTGISSPYEEPADADVRVDTTGRTIEDALDDVIAGLRDAGYLDLVRRRRRSRCAEPGDEPRTSRASEAAPAQRPLRVYGEHLPLAVHGDHRARSWPARTRRSSSPAPAPTGSASTPMDSVMAGALTERGLSAETFLSRPLTADLIEDADLVLTAEASHRAFILDDHAAAFRKVFTLGQVAEVVRNSPRAHRAGLLRALGERRGASEPRARRARPLRPRGQGRGRGRRTDRRAAARRRPRPGGTEEDPGMNDVFGGDFAPILAAGFFVGIVVGLTGMGGGALMTPALIFLGVGHTASIVTADLTAAAVYKTGGAIVHAREGSPNLALAKWLIIGSVPMALAGPYLVHARGRPRGHRRRPQAGHRLRAAARRVDVRAAALHQPAPGPRRRRRTATRTRRSGRSRPCWSARSAACWSASPASARAR